MANELELGIHGKRNAPLTKKKIEGIAFDTVGVLIRAEFQYAEAITITDFDKEMELIFGEHVESYYGHDIVDDMFIEAGSLNAIIKTLIGNTGAAIDAVAANATINDTGVIPQPTIYAEAGYLTKKRYGAAGNRIGLTTLYGTRESTTIAAAGAAAGQAFIPVNGLGKLQVGDLIHINATEYKTIAAIDEGNSRIQVDSNLVGSFVSNATIEAKGIQIHIWFKNRRGIVTEVEPDLGKIFVSLNPVCAKYYIGNVHSVNKYMNLSELSSTNTYEKRYPANITTIQYLTLGADGTVSLTVDNIKFNHSAFNSLDPQVLINPETTNVDYFKELKNYSVNRTKEDFPIVIVTPDSNLTKDGIIALGKKYISNSILPWGGVATWIGKPDQFANDPNAPYRERPPVGAVTGAWIRKVREKGNHTIPAEEGDVLFSAYSVVGHNNFDNIERTQIYDAGFNIIQDKNGIRIRNFRTFNLNDLYEHFSALLVENYFRNSGVQFSAYMENEPNVAKRVRVGAEAIKDFVWEFWNYGSNGKGTPGESMGQFEKSDNTLSTFPEHYILEFGPKVNPVDRLFTGQRVFDLWISLSTPTKRVVLGVGLMKPGLLSNAV